MVNPCAPARSGSTTDEIGHSPSRLLTHHRGKKTSTFHEPDHPKAQAREGPKPLPCPAARHSSSPLTRGFRELRPRTHAEPGSPNTSDGTSLLPSPATATKAAAGGHLQRGRKICFNSRDRIPQGVECPVGGHRCWPDPAVSGKIPPAIS